MPANTGFVHVMENLESHKIYEFHFPGLESDGVTFGRELA